MHTAGERWRLGHRPALDGLRALAVASVVVFHFGVPHRGSVGAAGVTVFFTLSGFLITALLLEERAKRGRISILSFYLRRLSRLGPALILCVALAVTVEAVTVGAVHDWSFVLGSVTWTNNFVAAYQGWDQWPVTPLQHTWSLAVEEQFYIVWPLLLCLLGRLRRNVALAVLVSLASLSMLIQDRASFEHAYLLPDARGNELLLGAALAFALVGSRARRVSGRWAALALLGILVLGTVLTDGRPVSAVPVAVLAVGVVFVAVQTSVRPLEARPLVWTGQRAYGIYLYHVPVLFLLDAVLPRASWWLTAAIVGPVTLVAAWASYRWVEQPIRACVRSEGNARHSKVIVEPPSDIAAQTSG